MTRLTDGTRLALSTLTVWPARAGRVDRRSAAVAMSLAPLVGALLGAVAAAAGYGVWSAGGPALLAGLIAVTVLALGTRGLHLDGLADTVDALGSYADRERALAIMKSPEVGPFAVVALVLILGIDATASGQLIASGHWAAVIVATATGRLGITLACRRGVPAARPDGLGALVAGTVPPLAADANVVALAAAGGVAVLSWVGGLAVLAAAAVASATVAHARRRLGGVTGDVLGACCELATAVCLAVLALA